MTSAAQWRGLIQQETAQYQGTPGGAPPWQIVEGMVDLESGGDPRNVTDVGNGDVAVGLGQITTRGLEYGLYRQKFPNGPTDLTDPQTNMRIMILGLDYREEQGEEAKKGGLPHALTNWFVTAAAYFGAGSNAGITDASDRFGTTGNSYTEHIRNYMRTVLKLSDTQIDAIAAGSNTGDALGSGSPDAEQMGNTFGLDDVPGASVVSNAIKGVESFFTEGFKRGIPAIAGFVLLAFGLYKVIVSS